MAAGCKYGQVAGSLKASPHQQQLKGAGMSAWQSALLLAQRGKRVKVKGCPAPLSGPAAGCSTPDSW